MLPAIIAFDFDGTLVDSEAGITRCMAQAAEAAGLSPELVAAWRQLIGIPLAEQLRRLLPGAPPERCDEIVAHYRFFWAQLPEEDLGRPFPGIPELLDDLRGRVPLAIATSKSQRGVQRVLALLGWQSRFDPVVTPDLVARGKPHPDSLLRVLAHHGVPAGRAIYVGDSRFDMEMAAAAGMEGWGVGWGIHPCAELARAGAARCFETPSQLRAAFAAA